jgi:hypothetical protein
MVRSRAEADRLAMNDTLAYFMEDAQTSLNSEEIAEFLEKISEAGD